MRPCLLVLTLLLPTGSKPALHSPSDLPHGTALIAVQTPTMIIMSADSRVSRKDGVIVSNSACKIRAGDHGLASLVGYYFDENTTFLTDDAVGRALGDPASDNAAKADEDLALSRLANLWNKEGRGIQAELSREHGRYADVFVFAHQSEDHLTLRKALVNMGSNGRFSWSSVVLDTPTAEANVIVTGGVATTLMNESKPLPFSQQQLPQQFFTKLFRARDEQEIIALSKQLIGLAVQRNKIEVGGPVDTVVLTPQAPPRWVTVKPYCKS